MAKNKPTFKGNLALRVQGAAVLASSKVAIPGELSSPEGSDFVFGGIHLIASYIDCDKARLDDHVGLGEAMERAIVESGASVMERTSHVFAGGGMTGVYVLAESHASIHTYPEHGSCFVDIFTCGYDCDPQQFDRLMRGYLSPGSVESRVIDRGASNSDL